MLNIEKPPQDEGPSIKLKSSDRIIVAGLPDSGKTTLARYLASFCTPNLIIVDPIGQYEQFDEHIPEGNRFVPERHDMADFENICRKLCMVNNHVLLVEECEEYLWQGISLPYHAYKVIRQGRNWGIGIIAISQRIQEVDKKFIDRCQHLFLFKCGFESFDYLRAKLGKERAKIILNLKSEQHEFIHYSIGQQTFYHYRLNLKGHRIESTEGEARTGESPDESPPSETRPPQQEQQPLPQQESPPLGTEPQPRRVAHFRESPQPP